MRLVLKAAALLVLVSLGAIGAASWWAYGVYLQPFKGFSGDEQFIEVPPGAGVGAISQRLAELGIVRHPLLFRAAVWEAGADRMLQAGEYRFDAASTPSDVVGRLIKGDVYLRSITFPEGLTLLEMAATFESRGFGTRDEFVAAAREGTLARAWDPEATDLEGYLFPETYSLSRQSTAKDLVAQMVARFRAHLTDELRTKAQARGLSVRQLVTLASLVEKETARGDERPLVAAVYTTRLRVGMPLQCDPTVIYALTRAGRFDGNLTRADLAFDSPYNTYRYPGLPPGPIASAGRAALLAAAEPADENFIYFVSRNDGSHAFARTLDEHNRNVFEYQVKYFRERRARQRAQAQP